MPISDHLESKSSFSIGQVQVRRFFLSSRLGNGGFKESRDGRTGQSNQEGNFPRGSLDSDSCLLFDPPWELKGIRLCRRPGLREQPTAPPLDREPGRVCSLCCQTQDVFSKLCHLWHVFHLHYLSSVSLSSSQISEQHKLWEAVGSPAQRALSRGNPQLFSFCLQTIWQLGKADLWW